MKVTRTSNHEWRWILSRDSNRHEFNNTRTYYGIDIIRIELWMVIMSLDEFYIQHHNFISLLLMFMLSRMCALNYSVLLGSQRETNVHSDISVYYCLYVYVGCQLFAQLKR